jgi:hypothetical protein
VSEVSKVYKVFWIYRVVTTDKKAALEEVRRNPQVYHVEFAKEEEPKGWFGALKHQLFGW